MIICICTLFVVKWERRERMAQTNGKTVLVTGGAGYIGSHCVVTLHEAGYEVIALDNFANSVDDGSDGAIALKRVEKITGKPVTFYKCDLLDTAHLEKIFQNVSNSHDLLVCFFFVTIVEHLKNCINCFQFSTKLILSSTLPLWKPSENPCNFRCCTTKITSLAWSICWK